MHGSLSSAHPWRRALKYACRRRGVLFWWAVLYGRRHQSGYAGGMLALFGTVMHTRLLGALLVVAQRPWYSVSDATTLQFGLSVIEDQQLAGLIMWVPTSCIYVAAALFLASLWIKSSGQAGPRG
jgi:putative membrane protein